RPRVWMTGTTRCPRGGSVAVGYCAWRENFDLVYADATPCRSRSRRRETSRVRRGSLTTHSSGRLHGSKEEDGQAQDGQAQDRQEGRRQAEDRQAEDRQAQDREAEDRQAEDRQAQDREAEDRQAQDRQAQDR